MAPPTLFLLHAIGLGARSWDGVVAALGDRFDAVAVGPAVDAATPAEAAERVAAAILDREPDTWLVAGDGTGGKVAAILAAWGERGEHGLTPPAGLVLVGGAAAPGPDPVDEARRERLVAAWSRDPVDAEAAAARLEDLVGGSGSDTAVEPAVVLSWLRRGMLEDWTDEVGRLRTPAAVVVGDRDPVVAAGGPALPAGEVVPDAAVSVVADAGRAVLLERPDAVAAAVAALWAAVEDRPRLPAAFARLIASDRVSARTRRVLLGRLAEPAADAPRALSPEQRALLGAVLARVVPQRGTDVDLAARIDADLGRGAGDGWRFAELPPDAEAWRRGLDTLLAAEPRFPALDAAAQDAVLDRLAAGDLPDGALSGAQAALWFQDVEAAGVRTWLCHPAAQAWIRYDGFADGGDGPRKQGFATTHAGEWEPWQRDWRTGKELQA